MATADRASYRDRLDFLHRIDREVVIAHNSDEWHDARRGRLTASVRASTIYSFGAKGIKTLRDTVNAELSDGWDRKRLEVEAMEWGTDHEPQALAALAFHLGVFIDEPGLVFHMDLPYVAATPDGLFVDGNKLVSVQAKCPMKPALHLEHVYKTKPLKPQYLRQVQWEAWVTRADRILFASFDPRQPAATQLALREIPVDLDMRERFRQNALRFEEIMDGGPLPTEGRIVGYNGIPELVT